MIPKVIHYFWFGGNEKSKLMKKCIKSWKKFCPDYEIIEWNEENYSLTDAPLYVKQAFQKKKWAFVTDYARLDIVYKFGGIYLDTDVELIKPLDDLLDNEAYFGFESSDKVNTGIGFAAVKGFDLLNNLMEDYKFLKFINDDGSINTKPCNYINTHCFTDYGFVLNNQLQIINGCTLYPSEYFSPKNYDMLKEVVTPNTHSIHHFSLTWQTDEQRNKHMKEIREDYFTHLPNKIVIKLFGNNNYNKIKSLFKK